ncbi:MAG TPA: MFS transporter [Streptosporangiaceae bacterium]
MLGAGTFLMGTTEFMIAGLLPQISDALDVSEAHAGLLISIFAAGMVVGTPVMTVLTLRLPRRLTLVLALAVFAVGHVIVALGSDFTVLLAARFLTALATGTFWAAAAAEAARLAAPGVTSRAIGVVLGGGMLSNVAGVPAGALAGQLSGWRGPFWAMAVLAALTALLVARVVPHDYGRARDAPVRAQVAGLRSGRLWLTLLACAMIMGGVLAAYSFISPLLTARSGLPGRMIPVALIGFGAGALGGSVIGGRLGDRRPYATTLAASAATAVTLLAICLVSRHALPVVVLLVLLGLTGMAVNPVLISLAVRFAGPAPALASALSTSSFNVGIAAGSWVAGITLDSSLRELGPPLVGTCIAALTVIPLLVLATRSRRGTGNGDPQPSDIRR